MIDNSDDDMFIPPSSMTFGSYLLTVSHSPSTLV